jgi:hypothetical protein
MFVPCIIRCSRNNQHNAPLPTVSALCSSGKACVVKDPESCAGSSFATGRVSHAGLVKGDDTD